MSLPEIKKWLTQHHEHPFGVTKIKLFTPWYFCFFIVASNKDSGCDIFANVPSDDEAEAVRELPDCDVMFEFSDVPLLPVYTITLKENEG